MNIIMLTIDSLRYDAFNKLYYSGKYNHLVKIFRKGFYFTNAFSAAPYTSASIFSLLTSLYPKNKPYFNQPYPLKGIIRIVSLPYQLKRRKYSLMGLIGTNPFVSKWTNYSSLFDYFNDYLEATEEMKKDIMISKILKVLEKIGISKKKIHFIKTYIFGIKEINGTAELLINEAKKLIKNRNRFFLWIHFMDVHVPHIPPRNHLFMRLKYVYYRLKYYNKPLHSVKKLLELLYQFYLYQIEYTLTQIDEFIEFIESQGLLDNTCIILTSDHGDEFGEHGGYAHTAKLYEELIHVPLLIYYPSIVDRFSKGIIDYTVNLIDLSRTIIELIDKKTYSILNIFSDEYYGKSGVISNAYNEKYDIFSLRSRKYKLIVYYNGKAIKNIELYDLMKDPNEKNNLAHENHKYLLEVALEIRKYVEARKRLAFLRKPSKIENFVI